MPRESREQGILRVDTHTGGTDTEQVSGSVAAGFEPVREAFVANFKSRNELGAACAVYRRGEKVVDLWGGYRDVAAETPWEEETMVLVFSTTKGMAAAAMALAHSWGLFELDDRIADHWPAFGQHGKREDPRKRALREAVYRCLD